MNSDHPWLNITDTTGPLVLGYIQHQIEVEYPRNTQTYRVPKTQPIVMIQVYLASILQRGGICLSLPGRVGVMLFHPLVLYNYLGSLILAAKADLLIELLCS